MTFTTVTPIEPVLDMVSIYGPWGPMAVPNNPATSPGSGAYEAANRTVYFPVYVPTRCTLRRFYWANGATAAGTIAAAIYTSVDFKPSARITTASAAQGTINQIQFVTPTAKVLVPNLYWLALSSTSVSSTFFANALSAHLIPLIKFHEAAVNCPATAAPVQATNTNIYAFGFSTQTTP